MTCCAATFTAESTSGASMLCATPLRSRTHRHASTANAACSPPSGSHGPLGTTGGPSRYPVTHASPVTCSMFCANPGRSRHGPVSPHAGIRATTRFGGRRVGSSSMMPNRSTTRGVKFSISTSQRSSNRRASACPSGRVMSSVMSRLPVFAPWNSGASSQGSAPLVAYAVPRRVPSGRCTDSTLITSAPSHPRICAAYGPAQYVVRSNTRMPSSGRRCSRPASAPRPASDTRAGSAATSSVSAPDAGRRAQRAQRLTPTTGTERAVARNPRPGSRPRCHAPAGGRAREGPRRCRPAPRARWRRRRVRGCRPRIGPTSTP